MTQLRKATRQKAKIRLGLSAVSGGGKTYSAILIAKGLCKGKLDKVAIIDTENGSADLYAHMGNFNVLTLTPPYPPEKYIQAIKDCEEAGMQVIIIDSITHEWDGAGGCLDIVEEMTKNDPKHNSYTQWRFVTPRHQAFIDAILQSSAHVITTVRRKQDYDMSNQNGKTVVTKAGLKEITRDGFEYELTANLEMDQLHNATVSKDRTGLFVDKPSFIPSEKTGAMILKWCETGTEAIPTKITPTKSNGFKSPVSGVDDFYPIWEKEVSGIASKSSLMELYNTHKETVDQDEKLKDMFKARQAKL